MSPKDTWEWPFLMYVGTVILRRPEKAFWRMTPRKLTSLMNVYVELKTPKDEKDTTQNKMGYIDQVL